MKMKMKMSVLVVCVYLLTTVCDGAKKGKHMEPKLSQLIDYGLNNIDSTSIDLNQRMETLSTIMQYHKVFIYH